MAYGRKHKWVHLGGSTCSDDGIWARLTDDPNVVEMYEFSYWEDSSAVEDYGKYNVQSGTVNVDLTRLDWCSPYEAAQLAREGRTFTRTRVDSALESCGWELWPEDGTDAAGDVWCPYTGDTVAKKGTPEFIWCIAECLWRHGTKDVACDTSGNNRRALIREAKQAL